MLLIDVDINCIKVNRFTGSSEKQPTKKTYFCSFQEVVKEYLYEADHHVLLPESNYVFHTIHMEYACHEPFSIRVYKQLLQEKKEALVAQYGCNPLYMTILPYIAGEFGEGSVKYLLGKSGKFSWTWYMYALSPDILLTLRQAYGSLLPTVVTMPRNLSALRFFGILLQRSSFTLLTVSDQAASLCQIKDGWYDQFATAPLGIHILLEAAEDQGVQKYLFRDYDDLQRNTVAQKLLLESLGFYASALAEWVGGFLREGSPLVICCPLISHALFTEVVQSTLQMKGAFVLPFAMLPDMPGKRILGNTDFVVSAYIHMFSPSL